MLKKIMMLLIFTVMPGIIWGFTNCSFVDTVTITDADIVGTRTLTPDTLYILSRLVFVEDGEILNIQAGTVIWGDTGQAENSCALVVARGGQVFANGTSTNPIIFTMKGDNVCDPYDIPFGTTGQWGGIVILGRSQINTALKVGQIEGISITEPRARYGDSTPVLNDNSGVLRYVCIRHGGTNIGEANEINGLTMGAVGSGTTIEYVEVFNNQDDGYEWFGGTVNCKYLISAFNNDDDFDYDEGFRGQGQFWFGIKDSTASFGADGNAEHDGGTTPEDGQPFAMPTIYNVTYLGSGKVGADAGINSRCFNVRDNAGAFYYNSIFADGNGRAMNIGNEGADTVSAFEDSERRLRVGDLAFEYNIWYGFKNYTGTLASIFPEIWVQNYLQGVAPYNVTDGTTNDVETVNPLLNGIARTDRAGILDPRLQAGSPALTDPVKSYPGDPFFTPVTYKGAFASGSSSDVTNAWYKDWTYTWQRGITHFICGDANSSGTVNILDVTAILAKLYKNGPPVMPPLAGDVNSSNSINILDVTAMIVFLYKGGAAPDCP